MADESSAYKPRCINFTSKSLIVFGEAFGADPEHEGGNAYCWCVCTSKPQGPDGNDVSLTECSNTARSCFQEY